MALGIPEIKSIQGEVGEPHLVLDRFVRTGSAGQIRPSTRWAAHLNEWARTTIMPRMVEG